mmetsp:Transcript_59814/g.126655  ORF Transcript_59814/g.126655 Transcript_59814/m.126655 type:complete len:244 (+) Transcript_59814:291-1022(+)
MALRIPPTTRSHPMIRCSHSQAVRRVDFSSPSTGLWGRTTALRGCRMVSATMTSPKIEWKLWKCSPSFSATMKMNPRIVSRTVTHCSALWYLNHLPTCNFRAMMAPIGPSPAQATSMQIAWAKRRAVPDFFPESETLPVAKSIEQPPALWPWESRVKEPESLYAQITCWEEPGWMAISELPLAAKVRENRMIVEPDSWVQEAPGTVVPLASMYEVVKYLFTSPPAQTTMSAPSPCPVIDVTVP